MAGISGVGVAVASGGALLIYAGLRGVNPLDALRAVASGNPDAILNANGGRALTNSGGDSVLGGAVGYPPLLQAVQPFKGDTYSQARRWDPGFSDCSSFVGKGFKSLGIKPPGMSTTGEYLVWRMLQKLPDEMLSGPGDLLISTSHMAVVVTGGSGGTAIGQQRPGVNVRTGTYKDIMAGSGAYGVYRYSPANRNVSA